MLVKFEKYVGSFQGFREQYFLEIVMNGLKEDVGVELKLYEPHTLLEPMNKARRIEETTWTVNNRRQVQEGRSNGSFQTYHVQDL